MFRAGDRAFTRGQVLHAASIRSALDPLRETIRLGLIARRYAEDEEFQIDADALQSAAETYRIERDLSTAEDTERWLEAHGLSIDDFVEWLERLAWRERFSTRLEALGEEYDVEQEDVDGLLWAEVVFGDHLPLFARALAVRVAAWRERGAAGEGLSWAEELAAMEDAFDAVREEAAGPDNLAREFAARRSLLIRFEVQMASFASIDAAREAWLCVTGDGEALDDLAAAAGAELTSAERFLDELPASIQDRVLSSAPGEVLPPVEDGEGFVVCRVAAKRVPATAEEPAVADRLEAILVERALSDLLHKHVTLLFADSLEAQGAGAAG